ncbi:LANO_0B04280g1_1 [Lachancea nothofagi CBS 11611]|uniref:LANO_0B04280g1_1 n=1 Tax=Lachancea nothofagi CBS 11611 TaxID=1266666 RepID=A0A1G4IXF1_9SACH|nr:LANO_0B04280g1_1 [Lachancea nothofagi CBS 11611]
MSLNRQQREKFTASHISHKYNLVHLLPSIGQSQLSGLYLKSFYNGVKRNRLQLPEQVTDGTKFCENCGLVHIAGVNLDMKIVDNPYGNDLKTKTLEYKCSKCGEVKHFPVERREFEEPQKAPESFVATWPGPQNSKKENAHSDSSKVKKSSGKERAKKRKMNSLANMLSKKKEQEANKKSMSLSLDDFLQK